jgi:hypothetical protein
MKRRTIDSRDLGDGTCTRKVAVEYALTCS